MNKKEILARWGGPTKVGSDGHVRLVDYMGSDSAIVQAARVSYGAGTKTISDDRNLIRYLIRHRHTTPFEMVVLKFHVRVPMDCWRQWVRHRTASINEYSTRYSVAIAQKSTTQPGEWRLQSTNNKQGSSGFVKEYPDNPTYKGETVHPQEYLSYFEQDLHDFSTKVYEQRLHFGVAREQARKDLPLSTYTEAYWQMNLHNLFHFLRLRMHPHAQLEIREFAEQIFRIVKDIVPVAAEAFEDYALGGQYFSREEMKCLHAMLNGAMGVALYTNDFKTDSNSILYTRELFDGVASLSETQNVMPATPNDLNNKERKKLLSRFINNKRERVEFWKKINPDLSQTGKKAKDETQ